MKCHQCGNTMVSSAKSQGGYEFCSIDCSIRAAPRLQDEASRAEEARAISFTIPLLSLGHAVAPLLLYFVWRAVGLPDWGIMKLAVLLFWTWPVWLWPLIRYRRRDTHLFGFAALMLWLLGLLAATLPILGTVMWAFGGIHV